MIGLDSIRILWRTYGHYRWHLFALALAGFLSAILEGIGINAAIPLISFFTGGGASDDFISNAIKGLFAFLNIPFSFRYLLGFILGLFILRSVSMVVFGYVRGWISADFLGKESSELLGRLMNASWPFLLKQKMGTLQNTLVRDIQCSGSLLTVLGQLIQSGSGFLMYLLVALNISPKVTLYTLIGGGILFFVVRPLLRRTRVVAERVTQAEKDFAQFLGEHIIGMKSIKAAGGEEPALFSGRTQITLLRALSLRLTLVRSVSSSLFQPASLVLVVLLFISAYSTPGFSIISFAATLYLIQKIFIYLESGQNALHAIGEYLPYARNISAFKAELGRHRESVSDGDRPFAFKKVLSFSGVSFAYNEGKPVLSDVSFDIRAGETIGLVGPSGSGKTSTADLLLRLFTPQKGALTVDGEPLDSFSLKDWRRHVGYVPQDAFLLNGTIEENIRFYHDDVSHEEIVVAAKQANIHDFIEGLPHGYNTQVGDRGVMLSGGQRQRIVLARALAGKPSLLILDEATSALDHESEKLIQETIAKLHGTVTVFIIAHRASTVAEADTIVVLSRGRIVERGAPQELLKDRSSYFSKMQHAA
jgi:ABC-type multidrug transport system fused ATPase/permease subunit